MQINYKYKILNYIKNKMIQYLILHTEGELFINYLLNVY